MKISKYGPKEDSYTTIEEWLKKAQCSYIRCLHPPKVEVFKSSNITFFGSNFYIEEDNFKENVLILDLAGVMQANSFLNMESILPPWQKTKILKLSWQDFEIPLVSKTDWQRIKDFILEMSKQYEEVEVICCCEGGHGRTGTALAILSNFFLAKRRPVLFIRKVYCDKAVETIRQEKYVKVITGT